MSKSKHARAGAFVVGGLGLLAFVIVVFGGLKFWERENSYRIEFDESVRGLEKGAYVYLEGIRVGQVTDIGFGTTSKVVVTIEVEADTPIHTDTRALLQFAGITGLKVIDLEAGTPSAPRIPDGGTIEQGETTLDKFETKAQEVVEQSTQLMQRANQIVDNLVAITDPTQFEALQEILANTKTLTANLARATARLDGIVGDGKVRSLLANAETFLARLDGMVRANEGPLRSAVFDLRQASRNFKELSRDVRQRPSRLLYSPSPSERKLP
jgi:phospholipid/cholesterol/gamma-HCH transport system substrate-binding protein